MTYEHILVDREDGVGLITLNRPEKLNAMNRQLSGELRDAVNELDAVTGSAASSSPAPAELFPPAVTFMSSAKTIAVIRRKSWTPAAAAAAMTSPPTQSRQSA
jgi:hypothetical protein